MGNPDELIKHVINFVAELVSEWNGWHFDKNTDYAATYKAELLEEYLKCGGDIKVYLANEAEALQLRMDAEKKA